MSDTTIVLFTFTATEAAAVDVLIDSLTGNGWRSEFGGLGQEKRISWPRPSGNGTVFLWHRPLYSQGNVAAAGALTRAFEDFKPSQSVEYYIFYGCCGVISPDDVGRVFRVVSVSYLSLGVVDADKPKSTIAEGEGDLHTGQVTSPAVSPGVEAGEADSGPAGAGEIVKLKSKWITKTEAAQDPLPVYALKHELDELMDLGVVDAHALATDKVIRVPPASKAPAKADGKDVYPDTEWSYAEAIAQYIRDSNGTRDPDDIASADFRPILIDMESYGIASSSVPIGINQYVVALRVATDALIDKEGQGKPEQQRILTEGLPGLNRVIRRIVGFGG